MNSLSLSNIGNISHQTSTTYAGYKNQPSTIEDLTRRALALFKLELFARVTVKENSKRDSTDSTEDVYDLNEGICSLADKTLNN